MIADDRLKLVRCDHGQTLHDVTPIFTGRGSDDSKTLIAGVGTSFKHTVDGVDRTIIFMAMDKSYVVRVELDPQTKHYESKVMNVTYDVYIDAVTTCIRNDSTESALFLVRASKEEYVIFEIIYEVGAVVVRQLLKFDAQTKSGYVLRPKRISAFDINGDGLMDIAVGFVNTRFGSTDENVFHFRMTDQTQNNIEVFINKGGATFDKHVRATFPITYLIDMDSFSDEIVALEYGGSILDRIKKPM
ncbi:hypothetical protein CYMTET_39599 [Cymbomonas tetramitiformis]|uniref:Uncharacterized protein n=1 Tax=Cymbomonas tetramitiformis TaxID=36881 RepID=A0AAE0CBU2_9CHLO|nr:hypothetical protein CYMTET_39599 [Cymbomonas tetramitiformis]